MSISMGRYAGGNANAKDAKTRRGVVDGLERRSIALLFSPARLSRSMPAYIVELSFLN
jgi:hypothetical protein